MTDSDWDGVLEANQFYTRAEMANAGEHVVFYKGNTPIATVVLPIVRINRIALGLVADSQILAASFIEHAKAFAAAYNRVAKE